MVKETELLKKYKVELDEGTKEQNNQQREVILFFSFDVVNSSLYKTINYYGWAQTLVELFKKLNQRVKEVICEAELWRVLGDEAIFIVRIKSEESIYDYVDLIFDVLIKTIKDLKTGNFFDNMDNFNSREVNLMKVQNILSLKAAVWIATVSKFQSSTEKAENIFEEYELEKQNKFYEFLGNDIDAGFRIAKYTSDSRLVVSFELAALLARRTESLQNLTIVTYKHLKGIWNNRYYPIIWYHNEKIFDNQNLEDTFDYDGEDNDDLIKEFLNNRSEGQTIDGIHDIKMFTNPMEAIRKILYDRNLKEKIDEMLNVIQNMNNCSIDYLKSPTLELHCVAVCYNKINNKILIAKRNDDREIESKKWEFGCAKASRDTDISSRTVEEYKDDFGIDIEIVKDSSRVD